MEAEEALTFTYTNYRGETAVRRVRARGASFHFGATEWHPEPQWLMSAMDLDKGRFREFAVKDIVFGSPPAIPAAVAQHCTWGYERIVDFFDKDETAGSFLREDGEGGFVSGLYRMAREIDRLRAASLTAAPKATEARQGFDAKALLDGLISIERGNAWSEETNDLGRAQSLGYEKACADIAKLVCAVIHNADEGGVSADGGGWKTIDSAPKDGSCFLATHDKSGVVQVTWYGKTSHVPLYGWCEGEDAEDIDLWKPTHWMPLPVPPALTEAKEDRT